MKLEKTAKTMGEMEVDRTPSMTGRVWRAVRWRRWGAGLVGLRNLGLPATSPACSILNIPKLLIDTGPAPIHPGEAPAEPQSDFVVQFSSSQRPC